MAEATPHPFKLTVDQLNAGIAERDSGLAQDNLRQEKTNEATSHPVDKLKKKERSPDDILRIIEGLDYNQARLALLEEKYGGSVEKLGLSKLRAILNGDLDFTQDKDNIKRNYWNEAARKGWSVITDKKVLVGGATAVTISLLTGGAGAIASGAYFGSIVGKVGAEAAESIASDKTEHEARRKLFIAERERWADLKSLAAEYREAQLNNNPEASAKLQQLITDYRSNTSAAIEEAKGDHQEAKQRWDKIRGWSQFAGGLAGGLVNLSHAFNIGQFKNLDIDHNLWSRIASGNIDHLKNAFHTVVQGNDSWDFINKAGDVVGRGAGHVLTQGGGHHILNETAGAIARADLEKSLPTLLAIGLGSAWDNNKSKNIESIYGAPNGPAPAETVPDNVSESNNVIPSNEPGNNPEKEEAEHKEPKPGDWYFVVNLEVKPIKGLDKKINYTGRVNIVKNEEGLWLHLLDSKDGTDTDSLLETPTLIDLTESLKKEVAKSQEGAYGKAAQEMIGEGGRFKELFDKLATGQELTFKDGLANIGLDKKYIINRLNKTENSIELVEKGQPVNEANLHRFTLSKALFHIDKLKTQEETKESTEKEEKEANLKPREKALKLVEEHGILPDGVNGFNEGQVWCWGGDRADDADNYYMVSGLNSDYIWLKPIEQGRDYDRVLPRTERMRFDKFIKEADPESTYFIDKEIRK